MWPKKASEPAVEKTAEEAPDLSKSFLFRRFEPEPCSLKIHLRQPIDGASIIEHKNATCSERGGFFYVLVRIPVSDPVVDPPRRFWYPVEMIARVEQVFNVRP